MIKSILIIFLCFLFSLNSNAQNDNYFINQNGEKIIMYKNMDKKSYIKYNHMFDSDYALTGQFFWYHDENGELKKESQAKVMEVYYSGRHYINKPTKGKNGTRRLHEVIIYSDNYILTEYYFAEYYWVYFFDKKTGSNILDKKFRSDKPSDCDYLIKNILSKKFENCEELIDQLTDQLENAEGYFPTLFKGVSNYKCE